MRVEGGSHDHTENISNHVSHKREVSPVASPQKHAEDLQPLPAHYMRYEVRDRVTASR